MLVYGFTRTNHPMSATQLFVQALQELLVYAPSEEGVTLLLEEALAESAQINLSLLQRFQLLERIDPVLQSYVRKQRLALLSQAMPMVQRYQAGYATHSIQQALAVAYMTLFVTPDILAIQPDAVSAEPMISRVAKSVDQHTQGIAMHRALRILTELQKWHCQIYRVLPPLFWHNLHCIYVHAKILGLLDYSPLIQTNGHATPLTVLNCYKVALILSAASTARMRTQEIDELHGLLTKWVGAVKFHDTANAGDLFLVNPYSDKGPIYCSLVASKVAHASAWCSIDTAELTAKLHNLLLTLDQSGQEEIKVEEKFLKKTWITQLLHAWGNPPSRKYRRTTAVVGHRRLQVAWIREDDLQMATAIQTWDIVNTSPGGYCVSTTALESLVLEVGLLLRIRESAQPVVDEHDNLAIVRWLMYSTENTVQMGLELLAPRVRRDILHIGRRQIPVLLLPEIPQMNKSASIILPRAIGQLEDAIHLAQGPAQVTKQLENSPHFEHYQIAFVDK